MGCGGIGGIIYKVVKIVVVAVASFYGGPLGAAAASAMFTLAEGGSFKEALISGAISGVAAYAGAQIGKMVSASASSIGTTAAQGVGDAAIAAGGPMGWAADAAGTSVFSPALTAGGGAISGTALETGTPFIPDLAPTHPLYQDPSLFTNRFTDVAGNVTADPFAAVNPAGTPLIDAAGRAVTPVSPLARLNDALPDMPQGVTNVVDTVSSLAKPITGPIQDAAAYWNNLADTPLMDFLPKFHAQQAPETWAQLIGKGAQGITEYTVGQALNAQMVGLEDAMVEEGGIPPGGFQQLSEIHRRAQIALRFNEIIEETGNPFVTPEMEEAALKQATEEFKAVISTGLDIRNQQLGADVTQEQFDASFNEPDLGQTLLANEQAARQEDYRTALGETFPGGAFQDIDQDIISSIVDERQAGPNTAISNFEARGNLNPLGGRTATQFVESQRPQATARVGEAAQGVGAGYQQDLFDIRDKAESEIGEYKLGDPLFDVAPFAEERGGLLAEQRERFPEDIRAATTNVPLFNVNAALNQAGREQGLVSGAGAQTPLLDTLAARESAAKRSDRGVSSIGSGTF